MFGRWEAGEPLGDPVVDLTPLPSSGLAWDRAAHAVVAAAAVMPRVRWERRTYDEIVNLPEFVPGWDVRRYDDGTPVTVPMAGGSCDRTTPLTDLQLDAVHRALQVWVSVCTSEGSAQAAAAARNLSDPDIWNQPNVGKSRLLGRMLHQGVPPTRTRPPKEAAGPAWWLLPDGDPFYREVLA